MRFKRIYIEITNVCNMNCSFCVPHKRENRFMTYEEFIHILNEIHEYTDYIYLHVKGEPLLHPEISKFIKTAFNMGYKINLTTNGTLLKNNLDITKYLRQINISFHATNEVEILKICKEITDCIINFRIWTLNENPKALKIIKDEFNIEAFPDNFTNYTLASNIFLSVQNKFDWPTMENTQTSNGYCHGLKSQIAILVDGTVVPCCLDNNGDINLGNIFNNPLKEILENKKSTNIIDGFSRRVAVHELCKKCTYKNRF